MLEDDARPYSLETGLGDVDRLALLNRYYNPGSERFLRSVGVGHTPFRRVLDVGCGQGQMAHFLSRELGAEAQVVGVDASAEQLEIAARTAERGERSQWVCTAADHLAPAGAGFDLVYSRFLLQHVAEPMAVLKAMVDAAAPGGLIVLEDALVEAFRVVPEPASPAQPWYEFWYRLGDVIGASYRFPAQLPLAVRSLGLEVVALESHQPVTFDRAAVRMHLMGFEQCAPLYRAHGIADEDEIAAQRASLVDALERSDGYVELYRALQIAAQKPR